MDSGGAWGDSCTCIRTQATSTWPDYAHTMRPCLAQKISTTPICRPAPDRGASSCTWKQHGHGCMQIRSHNFALVCFDLQQPWLVGAGGRTVIPSSRLHPDVEGHEVALLLREH